MPKFDLSQMRQEIREDEEAGEAPGKKELSQEEIRKMLLKRRPAQREKK